MRRGQDRHALADTVKDLVFPEGSGHLFGLQVGDAVDDVRARLGDGELDGGARRYTFDVEDPDDRGRELVLKVHQTVGRAHILTVLFRSTRRMDVDAPYRLIRKHLDKRWGKPDKEVSGTLKFLWRLRDGEVPAVTHVTRYTHNDAGVSVLEISTRIDGDVKLSPASGVKVGKSGPPPRETPGA